MPWQCVLYHAKWVEERGLGIVVVFCNNRHDAFELI